MNERYKSVITIGYFVLGGVALIVVGLIVAFRPDATATIINFVGTTMAVASTGAVTFYMLGKQGEKQQHIATTVEKVEKQTNGNLSRALTEIEELRDQLAEAQIIPRKRVPK